MLSTYVLRRLSEIAATVESVRSDAHDQGIPGQPPQHPQAAAAGHHGQGASQKRTPVDLSRRGMRARYANQGQQVESVDGCGNSETQPPAALRITQREMAAFHDANVAKKLAEENYDRHRKVILEKELAGAMHEPGEFYAWCELKVTQSLSWASVRLILGPEAERRLREGIDHVKSHRLTVRSGPRPRRRGVRN
ncbi:hypothetical protein AYO47_02075 [Planctomyces sp. SCGC AG-212-M04]|nr:hypothetical protein AYO47_02075 [Planctomyces sp. SCGC AG-212-M04]